MPSSFLAPRDPRDMFALYTLLGGIGEIGNAFQHDIRLRQPTGAYTRQMLADYEASSEQQRKRQKEEDEERRRQALGRQFFGRYSTAAGGMPWRDPDTGQPLTGRGLADEMGLTPQQRTLFEGAYGATGEVPPAMLSRAFAAPKWKQVYSPQTGMMEWQPESAVTPGMPSAAPSAAPAPIIKEFKEGEGADARIVTKQFDVASGAWVPLSEAERWQAREEERPTLAQRGTNEEIRRARDWLRDSGLDPATLKERLGSGEDLFAWLDSQDPMVVRNWRQASQRKVGEDPEYESFWRQFAPAREISQVHQLDIPQQPSIPEPAINMLAPTPQPRSLADVIASQPYTEPPRMPTLADRLGLTPEPSARFTPQTVTDPATGKELVVVGGPDERGRWRIRDPETGREAWFTP